ncbi:unnamed protein product [Schistocephalus solidus]|uniref:Uncharacterized protein n=1 Tax=Schistocephalus solidus TaxID=70667 RepID=A0A183TCS0_SCHSO|nr:unnamed protein product [Schistocephalus solidus]
MMSALLTSLCFTSTHLRSLVFLLLVFLLRVVLILYWVSLTTVRSGQLSDAEVGAAAADLVYVSTYTTCPHKNKHQDFTQQRVERLTSQMCDIAGGHVKKELSQPDSQTTSQPLHTTHIGLTARSERDGLPISLATGYPARPQVTDSGTAFSEEVDSFKDIEARLLPNGQSKYDIIFRIDAARRVFSNLRKGLWTRRDISTDTKIRIYRASVRSILLYGCECWATRIEDERKLETFDHHCLRTILRVKYTDFVSNETARNRCENIARISKAIQARRLKWFRHVLCRPPYELSVTVLEPTPLPNRRHRRVGQLKTWLDTVRQDMEVVIGPSVFSVRRWRREWIELSRSCVEEHNP